MEIRHRMHTALPTLPQVQRARAVSPSATRLSRIKRQFILLSLFQQPDGALQVAQVQKLQDHGEHSHDHSDQAGNHRRIHAAGCHQDTHKQAGQQDHDQFHTKLEPEQAAPLSCQLGIPLRDQLAVGLEKNMRQD